MEEEVKETYCIHGEQQDCKKCHLIKAFIDDVIPRLEKAYFKLNARFPQKPPQGLDFQ
jgi:hypothetical protein